MYAFLALNFSTIADCRWYTRVVDRHNMAIYIELPGYEEKC